MSNEHAMAIWHNHQKSWLQASEVKSPGDGEIVVKALYSLISQGTEKTMITSKLPDQVAQHMRVPYMQGDFHTDFTYGYSMVGEVIQGDRSLKGKCVHLMHPHQSFATVRTSDVFMIPESINPQVATLASNMETAVNAIWDSELEMGDRVLIMGYGLIGALVAMLVQQFPGVKYTVLEKQNDRRQLATKHGHPVVENKMKKGEYDLIFNTTGSDQLLQNALGWLSQEGKIIELSWYGTKQSVLSLGSDFHYGRKRIISSQVSTIPIRKQAKWDYRRRKKLVFELLEKLNPAFLITDLIAFSESPKFYQDLRKGEITNFNTVIHY